MHENKEQVQVAVLVGVDLGRKDTDVEYSMKELENLATAAGAQVVGTMVQSRDRVDNAFYIGSGKVEELRDMAMKLEANMVIFDDELSPSQIRNIERVLEMKIIDRTMLILDIFASRAKSNLSKIQVELAQQKYMLPRLIGLGNSLSRTGGGIGTRGPGEQKLEIDRRRINERINDLKQKLKECQLDREVQRSQRIKSAIPLVSIVGYTNAGKSTLMNRILGMFEMTGSEVYVEDMLFATLDTSVRKIHIDNLREFLLSDTVGFVSKLPHSLVDAFKATLEEAIHADLLIHVVDGSNPDHDKQVDVTWKVLNEIGADIKKELLVMNKADKLNVEVASLQQHIDISAKTGMNVDKLIDLITQEIFADVHKVNFLIPYEKGSILNEIISASDLISQDYTETGTLLMVTCSSKIKNKFNQYISE